MMPEASCQCGEVLKGRAMKLMAMSLSPLVLRLLLLYESLSFFTERPNPCPCQEMLSAHNDVSSLLTRIIITQGEKTSHQCPTALHYAWWLKGKVCHLNVHRSCVSFLFITGISMCACLLGVSIYTRMCAHACPGQKPQVSSPVITLISCWSWIHQLN